jgi:hypothetical protein
MMEQPFNVSNDDGWGRERGTGGRRRIKTLADNIPPWDLPKLCNHPSYGVIKEYAIQSQSAAWTIQRGLSKFPATNIHISKRIPTLTELTARTLAQKIPPWDLPKVCDHPSYGIINKYAKPSQIAAWIIQRAYRHRLCIRDMQDIKDGMRPFFDTSDPQMVEESIDPCCICGQRWNWEDSNRCEVVHCPFHQLLKNGGNRHKHYSGKDAHFCRFFVCKPCGMEHTEKAMVVTERDGTACFVCAKGVVKRRKIEEDDSKGKGGPTVH